MIGVIPFLPFGNDDFWNSSEGRCVFQKSLEVLEETKSIDKIVVFSQKQAPPLSKPFDVEIIVVPECLQEYSGTSVSEMIRLAQAGLAQLDLDDNADIVVVGHRNPKLTPHDIEAGVQRFMDTNTPQISIRRTDDNPVQLFTTCNALNGGFIYLFERDSQQLEKVQERIVQAGCESLRDAIQHISRPLELNRITQNVSSYPSLLKAEVGTNGVASYTPVLGDEIQDFSGVLWLVESVDSVRALFLDAVDMDIKGAYGDVIGASGGWNNGRIILSLKGDKVYISAQTLTPEHTHIRLLPLSGQGDEAVHIPLIKTDPQQFDQAMIKDTTGAFIFSLISSGAFCDYSFKEDYPHDSNLWEPIDIYGSKRNTSTGKRISGRQQFPDVFEPDGALLIARMDQLRLCRGIWAKGGVEGFSLPKERQTFIENKIDFIRYELSNKDCEHHENRA